MYHSTTVVIDTDERLVVDLDGDRFSLRLGDIHESLTIIGSSHADAEAKIEWLEDAWNKIDALIVDLKARLAEQPVPVALDDTAYDLEPVQS